MSSVVVAGMGAVSPAGWGLPALREALVRARATEPVDLPHPTRGLPLRARVVPPPPSRPAFLAHPRLRRASAISHYTVSAALEALGHEDPLAPWTRDRLGVIFCSLCGGVRYTRRFYAETLQDPATASPLVFPETVFNAPASHLAAALGVTGECHTLLGDQSAFLQATALAADWLLAGRVDGCLVVGAEEMDWVVANAWRLFSRGTLPAEGAGALYLRRAPCPTSLAFLDCVTSPFPYTRRRSPAQACLEARGELPEPAPGEGLVCSRAGQAATDRPEDQAWKDWAGPVTSPKRFLGEGLMAGAAWQCIAAIDALHRGSAPASRVSVLGCNSQAIAARFTACPRPNDPTRFAPAT